ncbi:MAG TPA: hypothetical protein VGB87_15795 [Vicinamibacteria bacterium]
MRARSVRLVVALALAAVSALGAAQGRLRPPEFVTCDRNRLTSFTGRVVSLSRAGDATTLRMETDESTKERFVLRHPGSDATAWFTLGGRAFTAADWTALLPAGRLRAGARATVWVCADEPNPRVDWEAP